jgi:dTDP-4-amino-4,6-dideoxygalactose transaminase
MIPRHSLPFGVGRAISLLVSSSQASHASDLEKAYADTLGARVAVLLPSVRAGIHMTVLAGSLPGAVVIGPAYTCDTVHQALALSGARMRLVDAAPGSFLMSPQAIGASFEPDCALLISELYGIPCDVGMIEKECGAKARLRILDLAMCIPSSGRMRQLKATDMALYSFGWGKPMYAGWGGIACFQDPELAAKVREIRDRWTAPDGFGFRFRRNCRTLLRVAMNQRGVYGLWHEPHFYRVYRKVISGSSPEPSHAAPTPPPPGQAPEWTRPMTALNRKLALYNLHHAAQASELRHSQAELYHRRLVEPGAVRGPEREALPESHFPIRLPSRVRYGMCDYLRGRGIDTSTLFPLSPWVSAVGYPHAASAAAEVVTLPLGPGITPDEVRKISECVKDGLLALGC